MRSGDAQTPSRRCDGPARGRGLRELAEQARAGRVLVVATHTLQSYVESLPPGKAYASTRTVLREATGLALDEAGPLNAPALSREGSLYVYSYQSAAADLRAHAAQHSIILPRLAGLHVAPWLAGVRSPAASRSSPSSTGDDGISLLLVAAAAVAFAT
jgi:hypothetical protein